MNTDPQPCRKPRRSRIASAGEVVHPGQRQPQVVQRADLPRHPQGDHPAGPCLQANTDTAMAIFFHSERHFYSPT